MVELWYFTCESVCNLIMTFAVTFDLHLEKNCLLQAVFKIHASFMVELWYFMYEINLA